MSSLYPCLFLESDGYHILSDALRMPALREHGRKFLRERLQQIFKGPRDSKKSLTSDERIYLVYAIASVASIVVVIAATITLIVAHI
jgi:hypothetical protein